MSSTGEAIKTGLYKTWAWSMQTIERVSPRTKDRVVMVITKGHVAYLRRAKPSSTAGMAAPTLMLTIRGRKSGTPRTMPLFFMPDGERYVVVGSYGGDRRHPQWYHNLMAAGDAMMELDGQTRKVTAELASPTERAALWPRLLEVWPAYDEYQERQNTRDLPVVILSPCT